MSVGVALRSCRRGEVVGDDAVAVEEPLEIRVAGDPLAVTMRTPGADRALALGFLYGEGIVTALSDVASAAHVGCLGEEGFGNVIDVRPAPGVTLAAEALQGAKRGTLTTAACGVCGRRRISDLRARCGVVPAGPSMEAEVVAAATGRLRSLQVEFARTGGTHAAAILDVHGEILASAEDVGRHNAVDKVIGTLLIAGTLSEAVVLVVSGRSSFEIVQKAAAARIPVVASVSAASSLAIDLAQETGVTLAAFVREGAMNVYSHGERLRG